MEDAGRGWRRVVPSPKPIDIIEKDAICTIGAVLLGRGIDKDGHRATRPMIDHLWLL